MSDDARRPPTEVGSMRKRWSRRAGRGLWIVVPVVIAVATVVALGILTVALMARMLGGPG